MGLKLLRVIFEGTKGESLGGNIFDFITHLYMIKDLISGEKFGEIG